MPTHTYYFDPEEEIELNLDCPAEPERGPTYSSGGEPACPAEWSVNSITFLGVPTAKSSTAIALALWPDDPAAQQKFITAYDLRVEAAMEDADENYEPEYPED